MPRPNAPKRSRKRNRNRAGGAPPTPARATAAERQAARAAAPEAALRPARLAPERPQAPWHPFPLTEIAILVGSIAVLVGFSRGAHGGVPMIVGLAIAASAVLELCWREHRTGFRSHSTLLAFAPAVLFTAVMAALVGPVWTGPVALAGGVPIFLALFAWLRKRWQATGLSPRR